MFLFYGTGAPRVSHSLLHNGFPVLGPVPGPRNYGLTASQPGGVRACEDCLPAGTAETRLAELKRLVQELATDSEYFHSPTDSNAGRA